jgi:hypothetical protein
MIEGSIMRHTFALPLVMGLSATFLPLPVSVPGGLWIAQAQADSQQPAADSSEIARMLTVLGPEAAAQLQQWYDQTPENCGGPDQPGYLCSGVLLRATEANIEYFPWDPGQSSIDKGSVSFSWIRKDNSFSTPFARPNGFILYPPHEAPPEKDRSLTVLCTFPTNAFTNTRPERQGCGARSGSAIDTDFCQSLNIETAQQWIGRYEINQMRNGNICGWDLRVEPDQSVKWFNASSEAHQALPNDALWSVNNEVLLSVWQPGAGASLPLQSFFYSTGNARGRVNAQLDQIRYYRAFRQVLPIIQMKLPASKGEQASFSYDVRDQAVGPRASAYSVSFEDVPLGEHAEFESSGLSLFNLVGGIAEVTDERQSSALFNGHYVKADFSATMALPGGGPRTVSFSWGCDTGCRVEQVFQGVSSQLVPQGYSGPMVYGHFETVTSGPDVITLSIPDYTGNGKVFILDDVKVQPVPRVTDQGETP